MGVEENLYFSGDQLEQAKPNGPDLWADTFTGMDVSTPPPGTIDPSILYSMTSSGDSSRSKSNSSDVSENSLSLTNTDENKRSETGESHVSSFTTQIKTRGRKCRIVKKNGWAKIVLE